MKKINQLLIMLLCSAAMMACNSNSEPGSTDATLSVSKNDVILPIEGGAQEIEVFIDGTGSYSVLWVGDEWGKAVQTSRGFRVSAESNDKVGSRTATVMVFLKGSTAKQEITISQEGGTTTFENLPEEIEFIQWGGERYIRFNSDHSNWAATVEGNPDWITINNAIEKKKITITVKEAAVGNDRQANLTITSEGTSKTVVIKQSTFFYFLPADLSYEKTYDKIAEIEFARGMVRKQYTGDTYRGSVEFSTPSPVFPFLVYGHSNSKEQRYPGRIWLEAANEAVLLQPTFHKFLIDNGFEFVYSDVIYKQLAFYRKSDKMMVSVDLTRKEVVFDFRPSAPDNPSQQIKKYPTFSTFPAMEINTIGKTAEEIEAYENKKLSTFISHQNNIYFVKTIPTMSNPAIYRGYTISYATLKVVGYDDYYEDLNLGFFFKAHSTTDADPTYAMTTEFQKLAIASGYSYNKNTQIFSNWNNSTKLVAAGFNLYLPNQPSGHMLLLSHSLL